jgi:hypothetical protein
MNGVITHNGGGVCYYCYPNPSGTSDGGANGLTDNPVRSTQVPIIDYPGAPLGPEILTTPIFQLGTEILATPIFGVGPEILTTPIFEGGPEFLKTPLFERGAEFLKTPSWIIGRQVDAALPPRIRKLATAHITGSGDTVPRQRRCRWTAILQPCPVIKAQIGSTPPLRPPQARR